ncbi:DDE-type integrase/transposase/recombinase, partial [Prosthecobacter sp.]|uniref:DDE-type integrase/transposase/recombinase n=1 Tax=Prosthecobacter sp. TaxID=1965333 RepID=UPI0024891B5B
MRHRMRMRIPILPFCDFLIGGKLDEIEFDLTISDDWNSLAWVTMRVQRLWLREGLRVPQRQHKKRRLGNAQGGSQRLRATRINEVWCYDFVFDQTEDGRRLKWLPICDEFTRESVALEVEWRMESADVVRVLAAAMAQRGAPKYIRSDNGPEFIAHKVRDWISAQGFETRCIEPGSPCRTPAARASTAGCVTNCSTWKASAVWQRLKCWAKNGARTTVTSDCIRRWTTNPWLSLRNLSKQTKPTNKAASTPKTLI